MKKLNAIVKKLDRDFWHRELKPYRVNKIVPDLEEFEEEMQELYLAAERQKAHMYRGYESMGDIQADGSIDEVQSRGSTRIVFEKKDELYDWLSKLPNDPKKLYAIEVKGRSIAISFRHLIRDPAYSLNQVLYTDLAIGLAKKFGWRIFPSVTIVRSSVDAYEARQKKKNKGSRFKMEDLWIENAPFSKESEFDSDVGDDSDG
jgi:hypothetical protein